MAQCLALKGEWVGLIDMDSGGVGLRAASTWAIAGGSRPDSWVYNVSLPTPSGTPEQLVSSSAGVVHLRINADVATPWRGCSPLISCGLSASMLTNLEQRMGQEAKMRTGGILTHAHMHEDQAKALQADMEDSEGDIYLVEVGALGRPRESGTVQYEMAFRRFGANIPAGNIALRRDIANDVLGALGIPPILLTGGDGGSMREAERMALIAVQAYAALAAQELSEKLDDDITLSFPRLAEADIASKARAAGSLAGIEGITGDRALSIVGLA